MLKCICKEEVWRDRREKAGMCGNLHIYSKTGRYWSETDNIISLLWDITIYMLSSWFTFILWVVVNNFLGHLSVWHLWATTTLLFWGVRESLLESLLIFSFPPSTLGPPTSVLLLHWHHSYSANAFLVRQFCQYASVGLLNNVSWTLKFYSFWQGSPGSMTVIGHWQASLPLPTLDRKSVV